MTTCDGSSLYSTACVYGGVTDTLDDCGNANSAMAGGAGTAAGASFDIGNGFTAAVGYTGDGTTEGLLTKEGYDVYGGQLTYTADSYGASVTYANVESSTTIQHTGDLTDTGLQKKQELLFLQSVLDTKWEILQLLQIQSNGSLDFSGMK